MFGVADLPHVLFFFFNDTATTEIYTLSLHDALPISLGLGAAVSMSLAFAAQYWERVRREDPQYGELRALFHRARDRKSTRLNSSHSQISYAVFCLKKKKNINTSFTTCT